jgi:Leucine-rich repeat (LRR) protein
MIISSQGEACSPNDDINALDLNGTKALRDSLIKIKASTAGGEEALLAGTEIELGAEQEKLAKIEQEKQHKIEEARQALQDFRNYLAQSTGKAAQALPREEDLEYNYNPDTQECEITRLDGQDIVLDLAASGLQGELPLPPQLMVDWLKCLDNQLTTLPVLPASLTWLWCDSNQLTTLPELPDRLTTLWCNSNQLTALPELPDSLTKLHCVFNQLTALPKLPTNLTYLTCDSNQLTALPELPDSLTELSCSTNQLTTLPVLPDNLSRLDFRENPRLASDPATQLAIEAMVNRGGRVYS